MGRVSLLVSQGWRRELGQSTANFLLLRVGVLVQQVIRHGNEEIIIGIALFRSQMRSLMFSKCLDPWDTHTHIRTRFLRSLRGGSVNCLVKQDVG